MILSKLAELIEIAVYGEPPKQLKNMCQNYYEPYYYLMYLLAKQIQKGVIVELGVNNGWGVSSFAYGNPNIKVIGLDLNVSPVFVPDNVDFHLISALPPPEFIPNEIAILHIDTEHSYGNAKQEFEAYEPFLLPGAVVMFDDLHATDDGVLYAFSELPYTKIQCDELHPGNGYGVLIYE